MVESQNERGGLKVALFHGNCQAEALRMLFEATPSFTSEFRIEVVPAVHDFVADDLPRLRRLLTETDLVITQAVRDNYRGLPIGTNQLLRHAPNAQVVRIPALYSDALFPFQVYVRNKSGLPVDAPITVYHDLRAIALAASELAPDDAHEFLERYSPPFDVIRRAADFGDARLRDLERDSDVEVVDAITDPSTRTTSFWAVNHPTLRTLDLLSAAVMGHLGMPTETSALRVEILGRFRTPVEPPVIGALGLQGFSGDTWTVDDVQHSRASVIAAQVDFLREHDELLTSALEEHGDRLKALGLNRIEIDRREKTMNRESHRAPSVTADAPGWLKLPSRSDATRDEIGVKPQSYLPIYESLLQPFRGKAISILELGVWDGDSLMMWRDAFPGATILGVDLNPPLRDLGEGIVIVAGDQTDAERLDGIRREYAPDGFDVIIDDASHFGIETARTMQALYERHLRPGGVYVIEDWGTGYLDNWPDGRAMTTKLSIEGLDDNHKHEDGAVRMPNHDVGVVGLVKRLVDHVASGTISSLQPEQFENALQIASMSVYDGVVALHKPL